MLRGRGAKGGARQALSLQPVVHIIGLFVTALGVTMLLPAAVDGYAGHPDWQVFATASAVTVFCGAAMSLATAAPIPSLSVHQGFLFTTGVWLAAALAAAVPLMFAEFDLDFTNAFFEAMSGLTTTGATVVVGLDRAPPGILLWRAILQWVGGIGFIVVGLAILPFLQVGGMQLFRLESSEKSEKAVPQAKRFAFLLLSIYVGLSTACLIALLLAGMTPLEAIVHAMATVATGGFSTSDTSIAHFDSWAIEAVIAAFMLSGSLPFLLYLRFVQGRPGMLLRDQQVRGYLRFLAIVIIAFTAWMIVVRQMSPLDALRLVSFQVISMATTTAFIATDYTTWGDAAVIVLFLLTFVGGCSGSTTGALKVFRFDILYLALRNHIHRLIYPHGTFVAAYNGRKVTDDVFTGVLLFVGLYMITIAVVGVLLGLIGLDTISALSGAAGAVGNTGLGLGPVLGPTGSFADLPAAAKWVLSFAMLLGRLELFTVLALFSRSFWKQ
ncbi:MAG: TrkH family potassium uptake protein [Rhodospirillales bacterium]